MSVRVRLYAGVKERAGVGDLEVEGQTIAAVRKALAEACPPIADQLEYCRFAVADDFVEDAAPVADGAPVDVIPPVSGG